MSFAQLLSRIEALPRPTPGEVRVPPSEIVAFFVTCTRRMRKMKRQALAGLAGISVSTLERIERGESVEIASLEKIEDALGLARGYITSPRAPLSPEELAKEFEESAKQDLVRIRPLNTQVQVRILSECHSFITLSNIPNADCGGEATGLVEWLDLASFIRSGEGPRLHGKKIPLRDLYSSVLDYVGGLEKKGFNVLGGVLDFPIDGIPDWKVAVLYISTKNSDPGGKNREYISVDTSQFPRKVSLADCARWIDDD